MRAVPEKESSNWSLLIFFLSSYMQSMKQTGSEGARRLQLVWVCPCVCNELPAQKQAPGG